MDRSRLKFVAILSAAMLPALTIAILDSPASARVEEAILACILIVASGLSTASLIWIWRKLDCSLPMSAKSRRLLTWTLILAGVFVGAFALDRHLSNWAAEILAIATGFGAAIALLAGGQFSR